LRQNPFLGAGSRREGYYEGRGFQLTWALGHLATLKEPHDYDPPLNRWSLAALPFIPDRFELKPLGDIGAGKQLAVIKRLLISFIVGWSGRPRAQRSSRCNYR